MVHIKSSEEFIQQTLEPHLSSHPTKLIIFDFDETLCHLHLPWSEYVEEMHHYVQDLDNALFEELVRDHATLAMVNAFVQEHGQPVWDKDRDVSARFERERLAAAPCDTNLLQWIKRHRDEYHFAIWSSNCATTIRPILAAAGVKQYFRVKGNFVLVFQGCFEARK